MTFRFFFTAGLGILLSFSALARGAHDLWSATAVHLFVLFLFSALLLHASIQKKSEGLRWPMLGPFAAFILLLIISWTQSVNPSESLMTLKDWVCAVLLFYVACNVLNEDASRIFLAGIMVPVFWVQAGASIAQISWSNPFLMNTGRAWLGISENPGTLVNANIQAAFELFWIPVLYVQAQSAWQNQKRSRWYWFSGFIAALTCFTLSWSSWGWIVLLAAAAFWAQRKKIIRKNHILLGAFFTVALLTIKLWPHFSGSDASVYEPLNRIYWWQAAVRMAADYPWLGVGPGNYSSAFLAYKGAAPQNTLFAHGVIFEFLSGTGVTGLLLAGFLAFLFNKRMRQNPVRTPLEGAFRTGVGLAVVFCSISLGLEYLVNLLCLSVFLGAAASSARDSLFKPRISLAILAAGLSVIAAPYVTSAFMASRLIVTGRDQLKAAAWDDAAKSFTSAIEMDSLAWEPAEGLAKIAFAHFLHSKDPLELERALYFQGQAAQRNRLNAELWHGLGLYAQAAGNEPQAQTYFQQAARLRLRSKNL